MHGYAIKIVISSSIIIAAIIGLIRFRSILRDYYPFIFFIWIGLINDSLSLVFIFGKGSNAINSNIYVLVEYGLILLQFYYWNRDKITRYYFLLGLGLAVWISDNFIINNLNQNNSVFRIFYSFIIVLLSIEQVNIIIINHKNNLIKNAMFLICVAFLFYYGCKAFVEVFNAFHLQWSNIFLQRIITILYIVNLIANLLYAIVILCIPTKQEFTLPY